MYQNSGGGLAAVPLCKLLMVLSRLGKNSAADRIICAQEEDIDAKATAAARAKKAAKKARRKERDAALRAGIEHPLPAPASPAPDVRPDPEASQTSTHSTGSAEETAAAGASAAEEQAAAVRWAASEDCSEEAGPAGTARAEASEHSTCGDSAALAPAMSRAALPAPPAKAGRLLPPGWMACMGGPPAGHDSIEQPDTARAAASGGPETNAARVGVDAMGSDASTDAANADDVLSQLLGGLGA